MPKGKRKAKEVEEVEDELVVVKDDEKEDKKDKKKDDDEGDGEEGVGEKERMKLIKARRKQLLDDIRDEQNKLVAAAQVSQWFDVCCTCCTAHWVHTTHVH